MPNTTQYTPGDNILITLQFLQNVVSEEETKATEILTLTPPEDLIEGFECISIMLLLVCSELTEVPPEKIVPLTPQKILQNIKTLTLNSPPNYRHNYPTKTISNTTPYTPGDNILITLQYLNHIVSEQGTEANEILTLTTPEDLLEGFEYISTMLLLACSGLSQFPEKIVPLTPQEILQNLKTHTLAAPPKK